MFCGKIILICVLFLLIVILFEMVEIIVILFVEFSFLNIRVI